MASTALLVHMHYFDEIFHDRFATMWLRFIETALSFLLQGVNGRGLVEMNVGLQKTLKRKVQRC